MKIGSFCFVCYPKICRRTLKNKRAPLLCNFQDVCIISQPSVNSSSSYSLETPNLGQSQPFLAMRDLEIWWMTLKNHRSSLLCYFKLCASFHKRWLIQTRVTVLKRTILVKIDDFLSCGTLKCFFQFSSAFSTRGWLLFGFPAGVWKCYTSYDLRSFVLFPFDAMVMVVLLVPVPLCMEA